jgi:hypothetical protein
MVTMAAILSNFQRYSLVGRDDMLLSADAIQEPGEHLFGAKAGAERELLIKIFVPMAELSSAIQDIITEHKPQPAGYAVPGLAAILLKKGSMTLAEADLSAARLRPVITGLGLSADMTENLVREVQHRNTGRPSVAQALFHILSALLASIGRIGAESAVFAEPLFLADFPAPLHSELPSLTSREGEEEGKDQEDEQEGQGQGGGQAEPNAEGQGDDDEASVTFAGSRAGPVAFAPPLFDRARPSGGASTVVPPPLGQVRVSVYAFLSLSRVDSSHPVVPSRRARHSTSVFSGCYACCGVAGPLADPARPPVPGDVGRGLLAG